MELEDIYKYFKERIKEVYDIAGRGDPWVFLCCSSFIDYLVRATFNKEANGNHYKEFITNYFSLVDNRYKNFEYQSGEKDLPLQMYHVLRCGIIHSFSLIPDKIALDRGGRARSILLGHNKNGDTHFQPITDNGFDSVVFTAENFSLDIEKLVDEIFTNVIKSEPIVEINIKKWWTKYPPIMSLKILS